MYSEEIKFEFKITSKFLALLLGAKEAPSNSVNKFYTLALL